MSFKEGLTALAAIGFALGISKLPSATSKSVQEVSLEQRIPTHIPQPRPYGAPVTGIISSLCGKRISPCTEKETYHNGVDIANDFGTNIHATMDGTATAAEYLEDKGNTVIIQNIVNGTTWEVKYFHCSELRITKGQQIFFGDVVARMGDSGTATGAHVHYEIWKNGILMNPSDRSFGIPGEQYAKVQPKI